MTGLSTHGVAQSEAVTRAAQALSAAKSDLADLLTTPWFMRLDEGKAKIEAARIRVEDAEIVYAAAYKAYTNPFGVQKTVVA